MSENDFETRQMCRSPQCVSQHHLGLEAGCPRRCILELFRTRANFFFLLCLVELLLLLLLLLLQLGQNPAQFLGDIWLMFQNQKGAFIGLLSLFFDMSYLTKEDIKHIFMLILRMNYFVGNCPKMARECNYCRQSQPYFA